MPEKNVDNNFIRKSTSLSCSSDVSLQSPYQDLQSYKETNEEDFFFVPNHQEGLVIHEFQDPFDSLLQSSKRDSSEVRKSLRSRYGDYLDQSSDVLREINSYSYEDPFAVFLRSSGQLRLCKFIKIQPDSKLPWEFPFSSSLYLLIRKHLGRIQIAAKMLTWLHWLFHFT